MPYNTPLYFRTLYGKNAAHKLLARYKSMVEKFMTILLKEETNMRFLRNLFGKKESANPDLKESAQPNLFEEMQTVLRATLIPLGFEEKEESGRARYAEYSRGGLLVWLMWDIMDSLYWVSASSKTEMVNGQKNRVQDFVTECSSMKNADEFKNESIAKLNEWLVLQKVR